MVLAARGVYRIFISGRPGQAITVLRDILPGEFGLRCSETVLVTAEGTEVLTVFPRNLYVL
jgi:Xaa-Pro aminopeptidase